MAEEEEKKNDHFELICGLAIAVLAAALAINDLGSGKFGGDEIAARSGGEKAYSWYASKGLKENLAEGQRDTLAALLESGIIAPDKSPGVTKTLEQLDSQIARYKKEKKEILVGSAAVGQENWVQDIDGKLGQIKGAKEWESEIDALDSAGDIFDMGTLFLQLCLVVGAISLIMKEPRLRWSFFTAMLVLGGVGIIYSSRAYWMAFNA
jgi:hypothetical protein